MNQNSLYVLESKKLLGLDNFLNSKHSKKSIKKSLNNNNKNTLRNLLGLDKFLIKFENIWE